MLCPTYVADDSGLSGSPTASSGKSVSFKNHASDDTGNRTQKALLGAAPPSPLLLSRSHNSIEVLPFLFSPPPPLSRSGESKNGLAAAGGVVAQTALSASNATSTTAAATVSRHGVGKTTRKKTKVAKVCTWLLLGSAGALFNSWMDVLQYARFRTFGKGVLRSNHERFRDHRLD